MKTLISQFINFENNERLFELKIKEILIWDLIRVKVYASIKKKKYDIQYTKNSLKEKPLHSLIGVLQQIIFILTHPRLHSFKGKKEILVLGHPRRQKNGSFYEDIYTDILVKNLSENYSILSLELPLKQTHYRPINIKEVRYLDFIELRKTFSPYFSRFKMSKEEKKIVLAIEKKLSEEFNVKINLIQLVKEQVIKYTFTRKKVESIFRRLSPKAIITVDGYSFTKKVFTEIANEKGIKTIELQHGTMGSEHIAYNFPEKENPISFPLNYFSWGEYWYRDTKLPTKTKIFNVGFPYIENQKNKVHKINQKDNNILVSSQWTIGFELMEYINAFAKNAKDCNFIVKLHPIEHDAIRVYKKLAIHPNISFVTDEQNIYDLFAICKTHIGVYSTTLIEGLAFNLRTLIIPLKGHLIYSEMIERGFMFTVTSSVELNDILKRKIETRNLDEFWVSNAIENMAESIKKIIKQ